MPIQKGDLIASYPFNSLAYVIANLADFEAISFYLGIQQLGELVRVNFSVKPQSIATLQDREDFWREVCQAATEEFKKTDFYLDDFEFDKIEPSQATPDEEQVFFKPFRVKNGFGGAWYLVINQVLGGNVVPTEISQGLTHAYVAQEDEEGATPTNDDSQFTYNSYLETLNLNRTKS